MITAGIGALILVIGALAFPKRKRNLAEFRERGHAGQETMGPSLGVMVPFVFPVIGIMMILLGVLSEL